MTACTAARPRVMVDMSATLIHHGHVRLLKKAAEIGDVVVVLTTDDEIKKKKGYTPELSFEERKEIGEHPLREGSGGRSLAHYRRIHG